MKITIVFLAILAYSGKISAFLFPDDFHPMQNTLQWLGDRFGNAGNRYSQQPQRPQGSGSQGSRPQGLGPQSFGSQNWGTQGVVPQGAVPQGMSESQQGWRPIRTTPRPFFYPHHPALVAPRPSYLGNHNRPVQSQNEFVPEITYGRLPEFRPEDYK